MSIQEPHSAKPLIIWPVLQSAALDVVIKRWPEMQLFRKFTNELTEQRSFQVTASRAAVEVGTSECRRH